jgi:hypothetical protein
MTTVSTVVVMFALWTTGLQVASFGGIAWSTLLAGCAWLVVPALALAWLLSRRIATAYNAELPTSILLVERPPMTVWGLAIIAVIAAGLAGSYSLRFAILVLAIAGCFAAANRWPVNDAAAESNASGTSVTSRRPPAWLAWLGLAAVASVVAGVVIIANRPDFDDAEYLQLGLQTLRYPERAPNSFDASLGFVLEHFRFAPYRIVSYETFVALIAQSTGRDLLDIYYLALPGAAAVLSVLVAFVFLRFLLPLSWTLVALVLFAVLSLAWGETHWAYGNRLFVRMFQGKALLIAITTPLAILLGMIIVRRPTLAVWAGLLAVQVAAVGVSSSGVVTTLLATAIGLGVGLVLSPSRAALLAAAAGATTLIYPLGMALWLKRANARTSADITTLGSVGDIGASLGAAWRQGVVVAVLAVAVWLTSIIRQKSVSTGQLIADQEAPLRFALLVAASVLLALNPFVASLAASVIAKNMSWRLGWAAPMPLLLAAAFAFLLASAAWQPQARARYLHGLLPFSLLLAFLVQLPLAAPGSARWTLADTNGNSWGVAQHKTPPEYRYALSLAGAIERAAEERRRPLTALVEPRIGTWLTVVAPDLRLVMPGHGYPLTLQTVMDPADFARRMQLLQQVDKAASNVAEFQDLLDAYEVDVIVSTKPRQNGPPEFELIWRPPSKENGAALPSTPPPSMQR